MFQQSLQHIDIPVMTTYLILTAFVVINLCLSLREQLCYPVMRVMFGLDINALRARVLKSSGHFRAMFDVFFPDARIFELDAPSNNEQRL